MTSAVSTPRGLAIGYVDSENPTRYGHAALIGSNNTIEEDVALAPVVVGGLATVTPVGLAIVQGQLVAGYGDLVSTLGWLGGAPVTTPTPFMMFPEPTGAPRGSLAFFASGDRLVMWGTPTTFTPGALTGPLPVSLYSGSPGGPFTQVTSVDPSTILVQQPDGCGGVVSLSTTGSVLNVSWGSGSVPLGPTASLIGNMHSAGMTATTTGFGITWVDTDGIHLATLAWE